MRSFRHEVLALFVSILPSATACDETSYREVDLELAASSRVVADGPTRLGARPFRVSVAGMESPRETYAAYARVFEEVARRLGTDVVFIQRRTYAEVNELLAAGNLDAALLCTGGYLDLERTHPDSIEALAVPIVHGADTYRALLLVPATSPATSLTDLRGKRFAFTDSLSLSGHAWIQHELLELGTTPDAFFGSIVFTSSHDRSITAVARGLVDGAAVHGIVFEHLVGRDSSLATRTRVIQESPPVGTTPVVASTRLPASAREDLRRVLTTLGDDPVGAGVLRAVQIDRFSVPPPGLFESAAALTTK